MCCASAAAPLEGDFFVVADDEDSRLRIYNHNHPGAPAQTVDLAPVLGARGKDRKTDIEGAARVGDKIFWISSHSRNKDGKFRPNQQKFFATSIANEGGGVTLKMAGHPYERLLADLTQAPALARFNLLEASTKAPKADGGFNIEGLSATPEGHLLIGFRNPIPEGRALLVPLLNPEEVIQGRAAKFGESILLDLEKFGIRDMAYWEGKYLMVAGASDGSKKEKLFIWDGPGSEARQIKKVELSKFNPEAVVVYPSKGFSSFQLLSDDGSRQVGGIECERLTDPAQRRFRGVWVAP